MVKGSIQQENIALVNNYVHNIGTPKYIKQISTDTKDDCNTVIVGDFKILLSLMARSSI